MDVCGMDVAYSTLFILILQKSLNHENYSFQNYYLLLIDLLLFIEQLRSVIYRLVVIYGITITCYFKFSHSHQPSS